MHKGNGVAACFVPSVEANYITSSHFNPIIEGPIEVLVMLKEGVLDTAKHSSLRKMCTQTQVLQWALTRRKIWAEGKWWPRCGQQVRIYWRL
ncbi:hypothetical protein Golax_011623 [Gossypium laxum]|uniref:Uncharacterized protein n=1 Tax=Gossypium laxum TaxID=34288 RepID=A0A7J8ZME0_9ROSI|nr:hypothetical protein [Gossypium laxum]